MDSGFEDEVASDLERIKREIADSFDEELELEIDESRLDRLLAGQPGRTGRAELDRRVYFRELFRMQHELVRLQDWVQHRGLKVVAIFEGRDSAGKPSQLRRLPHGS